MTTLLYARSAAQADLFDSICMPDVIIKVIPEPRVGLRFNRLIVQHPDRVHDDRPVGFQSWDAFAEWLAIQAHGLLPGGHTDFI